MGQMWSEVFPPTPIFTEKELSDQTGKVFIVTGGASGVGYELVKILYGANATIYVAGRDQSKAESQITAAQSALPSSKGHLHFLELDLADLNSVKASAKQFLEKEKRLDVLWLNAGIMAPPPGMKSAQGHEIQLGTNCIAHYLFAELLRDTLTKTAKDPNTPAGSVRVVWLGSSAINVCPPGGVQFEDINFVEKNKTNKWKMYGQSKAGNVYLGSEFAKRYSKDGITSVSLNPGNLKTPLQRHQAEPFASMIRAICYEPIYGAYTELYAGLSPDVTPEKTGEYIIPWGRPAVLPTHLQTGRQALNPNVPGSGNAAKFYDYCAEQAKDFL